MSNEITDKHLECAEELISSSINDRMAKRQRAARVIAKHFPEPMNEARAREILGDWIGSGPKMNERIFGKDRLGWRKGMDCACLTGYFTAEQLEAVAWWMKNKGGNL